MEPPADPIHIVLAKLDHWLGALVKKLESINALPTLDEGARLAVASITEGDPVRPEPETLYRNCFIV